MGESDTTKPQNSGEKFHITTCECSPQELEAFIQTVDDYNSKDKCSQANKLPLLSIKTKPEETENGKIPVVLESIVEEPPSPLFWSTYLQNLEEIMNMKETLA